MENAEISPTNGAPRAASRHAYFFPAATILLASLNVWMAWVQWNSAGRRFRFGLDLAPLVSNWALGAKVPSLVLQGGEWWRLVTANFLHGSVPHLAWNMLALAMLGLSLERELGTYRVFATYVFAAVAGAATSLAFTAGTSLGASTGVMGLMGLLVVTHFRRRNTTVGGKQPFVLVTALVSIQFLMDYFQPQVDMFGHVGGFAGGLLAGVLLGDRHSEKKRPRAFQPWVAAAAALLVLAWGAGGLVASLPRQKVLLEAARERGRFRQIDALRKVLVERPYFAEARVHLATLLWTLGRGSEAVAELQAAIESRPGIQEGASGRQIRRQLLEFHYQRCMQMFEGRSWDEALESAEFVIANSTRRQLLSQVHNLYAWILADKLETRLDEAESHSRKSLELEPANAAYLDTLAWVYYKKGDLERAHATQQTALEKALGQLQDPDANSELQYHMGVIYERLGKRDEAKESYARAIRGRGRYPEASERLRRLYGLTDEPDPSLPQPGQDPAIIRGII